MFYLPGRIKIGSAPGTGAASSGVAEWKLSKRFRVRGHWRRPSPAWADQRLRWIEPRLKGPEMTSQNRRDARSMTFLASLGLSGAHEQSGLRFRVAEHGNRSSDRPDSATAGHGAAIPGA